MAPTMRFTVLDISSFDIIATSCLCSKSLHRQPQAKNTSLKQIPFQEAQVMKSANPMDAPDSPVGDQGLVIANNLPRKTYNGNTGVTLEKFHYFRECPAEIRNMIYKLLLKHEHTIQIASPFRARPRREGKTFAAIMFTDKATHAEASGWFYTLNTFAVGNNYWGSRMLANLHGLQEFMKIAPRHWLARIEHIEINVCAAKHPRFDDTERFYDHEEREGKMLMRISRILLAHFRGLRTIVVKAVNLGDKPLPSSIQTGLPVVQRGDWEVAGDALRTLLDGYTLGSTVHPGLNVTRFWWYEADRIKWKWDKENTGDRKKSLAGYVEAHRPQLLNHKGKWKVWGVTDDTMGLFRRYGAMGLK
ncbi:hypothetical protein BKA65DRAFT_481110 [Rhexocercosporidium sp. MPI-PUGE-AT-0058]|nr:hypothetical protein BKA65DRAFT_481110 [Rhexocercosporidium sp. MPI-PUGE-AT-0058]